VPPRMWSAPRSITPTRDGTVALGFRLTTASAWFEAKPDALTTHGSGWDGQRLPIFHCGRSAPPTGAATATASTATAPVFGLISGKGDHITDAGAVGEATWPAVDAGYPARGGGKPPQGCEKSSSTPGLEGRRRNPALLLGLQRRALVEGDRSGSLKALAVSAPDDETARKRIHQARLLPIVGPRQWRDLQPSGNPRLRKCAAWTQVRFHVSARMLR